MIPFSIFITYFSNNQRMDKALEGVDRLVIITPFSEEMLRVNNSWVDAAKRNKVGFIIKSGGTFPIMN